MRLNFLERKIKELIYVKLFSYQVLEHAPSSKTALNLKQRKNTKEIRSPHIRITR